MKYAIKILLINLAVMVGVFFIAEVGLRTYSTIKLCLKGECDGDLFTRFNRFDENKLVGLTKPDPVLGYRPNQGFSGIVHYPPGWENIYVSIDRHGFRRNTDDNQDLAPLAKDILTVGDSFTFGDQVKNSETWPACLAQKTGLDVWNGGVFGYGAAQAVLRAEQEVVRHGPFDTIIWSITVISDFFRDQLKVRSNFPKPHVVTVEEGTKVMPPPEWNPSPDFMWLLGYSVILKRYLFPIIEKKVNFSYDGRYDIPAEHAAELEEIVDLAFQRFAAIPGAKRKAVLLQYGAEVLEGLEKRNVIRKLVEKAGKKYHLEVIDSLDQVFIPEKKDKLWFGIPGMGHHTPYGNQVVCEVVLKWLTKELKGQSGSFDKVRSNSTKKVADPQALLAGQKFFRREVN